MSNETVSVKILDKDYQVACPADERMALLQSAQVLDERMRKIKNSGGVAGLERIAVMAALNLSHELILAQQVGQTSGVSQAVLDRMQSKIESQLNQLSGSE
ncbi:cell division protein ZapA [Gilvimarinus polysaccharolyticus]|uniref:cell division protein ZapA n=1 Tax=Gilvimarinus polysaccharolyticus TaxID=863921 RepID=UPI00067345ED|nr:cell division protein ZapA [Gilvimarinus polysaccharolyticus]